MKKFLLLLAAVFLLAAGCNKVQLKPGNQPVSEPANKQIQQPAAPSPGQSLESTVQTQAGNNLYGTTTVASPVIDYVKYYGQDGKSALDLLRVGHQVQTKTYSGIGEFVESIDGAQPDSKHFWEFFVNGKSSNVGAGGYKTQNGDVLEWKLSTINSSGE